MGVVYYFIKIEIYNPIPQVKIIYIYYSITNSTICNLDNYHLHLLLYNLGQLHLFY